MAWSLREGVSGVNGSEREGWEETPRCCAGWTDGWDRGVDVASSLCACDTHRGALADRPRVGCGLSASG